MIIFPVFLAISSVRSLPGSPFEGGAVVTPILGDIVDALEQSNTFELVSGTIDFVSWIVLDPYTYLAGAGFGVKAATSIARPANISRGRLVMRSLVPFYGRNANGVKFGITSNVVWALTARTAEESVEIARHSEKGRRMFAILKGASGPEEAGKLIPVLRDNAALPHLLDAARRGDNDWFWDAILNLLQQYNTLFKLGRANRRRGHKSPGLLALLKAWRFENQLVKRYPEND